MAYVGSLVGTTLEIDQSTFYRPEYARALIGCTDVEEIPDKAEGCLGDEFYDFYHEIDKIVVGGPPKSQMMFSMDHSSRDPSPKRARTEYNMQESSYGQTTRGNQISEATGYGKSYAPGLMNVSEHETKEESEGDQGLLFEKIIQERERERESSMPLIVGVKMAMNLVLW
jgi:hypothetical protein